VEQNLGQWIRKIGGTWHGTGALRRAWRMCTGCQRDRYVGRCLDGFLLTYTLRSVRIRWQVRMRSCYRCVRRRYGVNRAVGNWLAVQGGRHVSRRLGQE
jgi:hypothetical protein